MTETNILESSTWRWSETLSLTPYQEVLWELFAQRQHVSVSSALGLQDHTTCLVLYMGLVI